MRLNATIGEHKRLGRALERRYGKSMLPLSVTPAGSSPAYGNHWKVTDPETGAFLVGAFYCGRLYVLSEGLGDHEQAA